MLNQSFCIPAHPASVSAQAALRNRDTVENEPSHLRLPVSAVCLEDRLHTENGDSYALEFSGLTTFRISFVCPVPFSDNYTHKMNAESKGPTGRMPLCPWAPLRHCYNYSWATWSQTRCVTYSLLQSTVRLSYPICRLPSHTSQEILHIFSPREEQFNLSAVQADNCGHCLGLAPLSQFAPRFNSDGWFGHGICFDINWKTAPFLQ